MFNRIPDIGYDLSGFMDERMSVFTNRIMGRVLQGAAADCNSAGETYAWFDSRATHHYIGPLAQLVRAPDF